MDISETSLAPNKFMVWDPLVRIFHWSLVTTFTIAYLTGDEESQVHVYAGYTVIGLVLFRLLWGFIGTRHARFKDFMYRPATVFSYAKEVLTGKPKRYLGHNPLAGIMILLLLGSLLTTGITGYLLLGADAKHNQPAVTASASAPVPGKSASGIIAPVLADSSVAEKHGGHDEYEGPLKEIHEFFANFTLFLVFLHIAGVILSSLQHKENLVRAMITGRKSA